MADEDGHDMEDSSGYETSGVRHALLGVADLVSVLLHQQNVSYSRGVSRSVYEDV